MKYFPKLRILPEDYQGSESSIDEVITIDSHTKKDSTSVNVSVASASAVHSSDAVQLKKNFPYELRDEKNRKWYSYFNEYEYRFNKYYRTKKRAHWYEFLYPNHSKKTKAERHLLYKLDLIIALYFMMLCWSKSVDLSNYTSAYVSGMKEDLHMEGNDYIYTSTIANIGSIVFQLPFMYLLPRFPPHIILPFMDLGWTWFTFACYRVKSLAELRAYRFILSAFGAAYYPVSQYILGCWYAPDELASRVCLFFCGQLLGTVTSGLLQSKIYETLNGVHGIAGWRWMFLIDAIAISLPTAIIGFFIIPGVPSKCYSLILTDEEIRIARQRNRFNNIKDAVPKNELKKLWDLSIWKKVFGTSTFWVLVVFDTCSWNNFGSTGGAYSLWLKANPDYSISRINQLSVIPASLGFAYVLFCSFGADLARCKWIFMVFAAIMNVISCSILIKWDVADPTKWFAFFLTYFSVAASPCLWTFINDFLRLDPQIKAVTWIAIYSVSQSSYAWIPVLAWPTVDAPKFKRGYISSLIFGAIYGLWTFVVLYYYKRNEKRNAFNNGIILYDSSREEPPTFVADFMYKDDEGYYYAKDSTETYININTQDVEDEKDL